MLTADVWARVDKTATCWLWTGSITTAGYGNLRWAGRYDYAHRVVYALEIGPIPEGLVIDHLCRNRACVRPDHLEAVTQAVNVRRGLIPYFVLRSTCKRGHDITDPVNVYTAPSGEHRCRACAAELSMARRTPWPNECPQGHAYTEANTYRTPRGHRSCRECNRLRSAANYARKRATA